MKDKFRGLGELVGDYAQARKMFGVLLEEEAEAALAENAAADPALAAAGEDAVDIAVAAAAAAGAAAGDQAGAIAMEVN